MDVRLVLDEDRGKKQTWHLHHTETVVGRRRDCDLRIPAAEVSRRHCLLSITDGYVIVEDLDSVNGTFINGRRVVGKQVVRPGDHLEIGPLDFTVEYELTPSALERLAMREGKPEHAEELEALPLAEIDVEANAAAGDEPHQPAADQEDSIIRDPNAPPAFLDEGEAANWHLPQTNELRDLLSQLEQPQPKPPRRRD
jgi:pSer/pThr/pTyr-binding forkhead associated (FHA) protein